MLLVAACTPHDHTPVGLDIDEWDAYDPPTGPIGKPDDYIVAVSPGAQWIAVCRQDPGDSEPMPRLLVGDSIAMPIDSLHGEDPTGRYAVIDRDGERLLYDSVQRLDTRLGTPRDLTSGSFDADGTRLVYGERGGGEGGADRVVVHELDRGRTWSFVSPIRSLTNVELGRDPHHVWMTASEKPMPPHGGHMCNAISGCLSGLGHNPARHLLALLRDDGPVFVELDDDPLPHIAIGDDAVVQSAERIELVGPTGRQTIVDGECRVEHDDVDTLVIRCDVDDGAHQWWRWKGGVLAALDFESTTSDPVGRGALARGSAGAWLSLPTQTVVQGLAVHTEGDAWRDRVVLVSDTHAQVRNARTDQLIVEHEIAAVLRATSGPYVALESRSVESTDGWVIDLRTGSIRTFAGPITALSRSGHVAHEQSGRIRWQ